MRFTKMHGLGNDYIYVATFDQPVANPQALAVAMSRAHVGVHADGLVLIEPSDRADCAMRMFNADGSEGEMCGNAARCVGKYLYERGLTRKTRLTLATRAGVRMLALAVEHGRVREVTVDMGVPRLSPPDIPVALAGGEVRDHPLALGGQVHRITCVNMGNPHAVLFVADPWSLDIAAIGPHIERHPLFPQRTNVEFVRVVAPDLLEMRVWERGSGETRACGTGAAASLVAAVLNGLAQREARVRLAGGELWVRWDEASGHVFQAGPATFVFDGEWLGDDPCA